MQAFDLQSKHPSVANLAPGDFVPRRGTEKRLMYKAHSYLTSSCQLTQVNRKQDAAATFGPWRMLLLVSLLANDLKPGQAGVICKKLGPHLCARLHPMKV